MGGDQLAFGGRQLAVDVRRHQRIDEAAVRH
jgi:hypothetical protein